MNIHKICSKFCFGIEGYDGSCCIIENRNWIIGPHFDTVNFLKALSIKYGREISHSEVFIDFEEGYLLFPDKEVWQHKENYPALRIDIQHSRRPCIFYNTALKQCMCYDIRPYICREFECDYLKENK